MADYTDQIVVVDSGVIKKVSSSDNLILSGNLELGPASTLTIQSTGSIKHLDVTENLDVTGNAIVTGNLTVNGTTTTINSTTISVDDKNIELGSVDTPTDTTADSGGITLKGTTDHTILWKNSTDSWDFSEHVNAASGKEFKINNVSVLSATSLGSTVVGSSLTSVGTLTGLTVNGNVTVSDGTNDLNIASHDGTNGLQLGGTLVTSDAGELNLLDGAQAGTVVNSKAAIYGASGELNATTLQIGGSNIDATAAEINLLDANGTAGTITEGLQGDDKFIIHNDSNTTLELATIDDIKDYVQAAAGGSVAADDITTGNAAVNITTSAGNITVGASDFNQGILLDAADGVGTTFTGFEASTSYGGQLSSGNLVSGSILAYGIAGVDGTDSATWALTYADRDKHSYAVGVNMADTPIADVTLQATASLNIHTAQSFPVYVQFRSDDLPDALSDQGSFCYLTDGTDVGKAQMSVPSGGNIVRLGVVMSTGSNGGLYQVLWQPQFIADLG